MAFTVNKKAFCVLEFAKTESIVTVQRRFRIMYHTEPPTDKTIREWYMNSSRVAACALRNEPAVWAYGPGRPVRFAAHRQLHANVSFSYTEMYFTILTFFRPYTDYGEKFIIHTVHNKILSLLNKKGWSFWTHSTRGVEGIFVKFSSKGNEKK